MIQLIQTIETKIQATESKFTAAGLPPIALIDTYRGQPAFTSPSYSTPALFIETNTIWQKDGQAKNATLTINFHVVTDADLGYSESPTLEEKFSNEKYAAILKNILDDLEGDHSGKLKRKEEKSASTALINYHIISYECLYFEPVLSSWDINYATKDDERALAFETLPKTLSTIANQSYAGHLGHLQPPREIQDTGEA